jgi:S1-C subfamily serine protease
MKLSLTIEEEPKGYGLASSQVRPRGGRSTEAESLSVPRAGLEVTDLTEDRAEQLGMSIKGGALVLRVEPNGPAAEAGLTRGLVITKVDKKAVTSAEAAKAALEAADPAKGALVQAQSPQGGTEYVIVKVTAK